MSRKRKVSETPVEDISPYETIKEWNEVMKESTQSSSEGTKNRKRFVGVRQRPSGRWVAEIKDTIQKIRVWLGTYDTAEKAARAYDEAACILRGSNTRTNFLPSSKSSSSTHVLPSKIINLLLQRLKARTYPCDCGHNCESIYCGKMQENAADTVVMPLLRPKNSLYCGRYEPFIWDKMWENEAYAVESEVAMSLQRPQNPLYYGKMQENEANAVAIAMPHRPQNPVYYGYNCSFGPQFKTMSSSSYNSLYMNNKQKQQGDVYGNESTYITNEQFIDFFDGLEEDYNTGNNIEFCNSSSSAQIDDITSGFESCLTEKDESICKEKEMNIECNFSYVMTQTTSSDEREEDIDLSFQQNFQFLDNVNDVAMNYYSPFDIEEHVELEINDDDESSMLRNAMKRMKYERKISASLYAFNGIPECLKLKLGSENKAIEFSNELTNLKIACNKNKIDA
ncbi:uncharacterized protein LOC123892145 [Trifolium pratense]|uniref:uncharacterized protein LOC123892145 n=1 Tax=Trifolium pratense TaxID=57577 RepID=UPI001E693636|nr:uncharacterized protein LOC123892145 [Trifolium pratense]